MGRFHRVRIVQADSVALLSPSPRSCLSSGGAVMSAGSSYPVEPRLAGPWRSSWCRQAVVCARRLIQRYNVADPTRHGAYRVHWWEETIYEQVVAAVAAAQEARLAPRRFPPPFPAKQKRIGERPPPRHRLIRWGPSMTTAITRRRARSRASRHLRRIFPHRHPRCLTRQSLSAHPASSAALGLIVPFLGRVAE